MTFSFVEEKLLSRRQHNQFRQRRCISTVSDQNIRIDGQNYINFSSNDYLGLNNHLKINQALEEGASRFGVSSTSSSLVTGFSYAHQALESEICQWLNKPKCILYNAGFSANLGTMQAIKQGEVDLFLDKLSHASLLDGALLDNHKTNSRLKRFNHNDIGHLSKLLSRSDKEKLVVTESVFSMDGDCAPLKKLSDTCHNFSSELFIDDAHGIGILGDQGQGASSVIDSTITMATFGKAIATQGAVVACDQSLFEYFVNFSREYIYSTAMSPAIAWATLQSIKLVQAEHWRREKVQELSQLFKNELDSSISLLPTQSSIHAIVVGDEEVTLRISNVLAKKGFWLTPIRPPTVPKGTSRLRVTICQNHNTKDIIRLAKEINRAMQ